MEHLAIAHPSALCRPIPWPVRSPRAARLRLGATLALLLLLAASGCAPPEQDAGPEQGPDPNAEAGEREERRTPVEAVTMERGRFADRVELIGETEAGRTAMITAEIPGRIVSLTVDEGDSVRAGEEVLRVDTSQQRAAAGPLEVQLRQLENEIERSRRLIDRGLGTAATVEQLEAQRDATREQLAQIALANRQARVRAPFAGIVVEKMTEVGEFANPGVPLLRVADHGRMRVRVGVPEGDIRHVSEGMAVDVRIDALDRVLAGEVRRIGVELDGRNRTFPVEIALDNADGQVRSGMRSVVTITRGVMEDAVILPRDAVVQGFDQVEVIVVEEDRAVQRRVVLGRGLGPFVVVREGLRPGEMVVVRGQRRLVDGERLTVVESRPCCTEQFGAWDADRTRARAEVAP